MMVMPANNTGIRIGHLAGKFPGRMGHLFSPGAQRGPFGFMPYALDNGAFAKKDAWEESEWIDLLDWAKLSGQRPLWAIVPDVVGDRIRTLRKWDLYAPRLAAYGWPLAFAVQDGMTEEDVPNEAAVVFVGGTTEWKWRTVAMWCSAFRSVTSRCKSVHVGRVNEYRRLWECHDAGAASCDGTGWTRGDQRQARGLVAYLEESSGIKKRPVQRELDYGKEDLHCIEEIQ